MPDVRAPFTSPHRTESGVLTRPLQIWCPGVIFTTVNQRCALPGVASARQRAKASRFPAHSPDSERSEPPCPRPTASEASRFPALSPLPDRERSDSLLNFRDRAIVRRINRTEIEDDAIVMYPRDDGRLEVAQVLLDLIRRHPVA